MGQKLGSYLDVPLEISTVENLDRDDRSKVLRLGGERCIRRESPHTILRRQRFRILISDRVVTGTHEEEGCQGRELGGLLVLDNAEEPRDLSESWLCSASIP